MTGRTNDLLAHAHDVVGDAAGVVADTAAHIKDTISSTVEHAAARVPGRRPTPRSKMPVVFVLLVLGAVVFAISRRVRAGVGEATTESQSRDERTPVGASRGAA